MSELVRDWKAEKKDLEDAFDIIADKLVKADAEIERLKADLDYWHHIATVEKNGLITELCDALDGPRFDAITQRELVERAREGTR